MELRNLLELLYTARNRFSSIQVTWHYWVYIDRMNEAHEKWAAQFPAGSVAVLRASSGKTGKTAQEWNIRNRVWWQKPDCWRLENQRENQDLLTKILCESRWWNYSSRDGKLSTNVETPEKAPGLRIRKSRLKNMRIPSIEDEIKDTPIVDPSFLLAIHNLQPQENVVHAGREAGRVTGVPRKGRDLSWEPQFWSAADEYEFLVDQERGVLLRYSAKLKGQEYAIASVDELIFDDLIPESVFSFTPPPNTSVDVIF
jgi:outer membrane lipoprotein-sorting protein